MSDLPRDVMMFNELANEIDADVETIDADTLSPEMVDQALTCWALLEEANRTLAGARSALAKKLAGVMPEDSPKSKRHTIEGVGTFERHMPKDRTKWDKDALLSAVLDSRLVNPHTGEVKEETPLERVLACFNLPAPRITALRERDIDADQFCQVEKRGWTLQVIQ